MENSRKRKKIKIKPGRCSGYGRRSRSNLEMQLVREKIEIEPGDAVERKSNQISFLGTTCSNVFCATNVKRNALSHCVPSHPTYQTVPDIQDWFYLLNEPEPSNLLLQSLWTAMANR
ncbi:hypothetical protein DVH24_009392 [Malus domestica]|uniref:Uncharacterized protein n=1 Tax=Malus domestica TaxID=3750 RepID=A0A498IW89_MALDO|nr:hypothetical protein DVH24_009392 [Malus domestica]